MLNDDDYNDDHGRDGLLWLVRAYRRVPTALVDSEAHIAALELENATLRDMLDDAHDAAVAMAADLEDMVRTFLPTATFCESGRTNLQTASIAYATVSAIPARKKMN
jgi:hypothetical protein